MPAALATIALMLSVYAERPRPPRVCRSRPSTSRLAPAMTRPAALLTTLLTTLLLALVVACSSPVSTPLDASTGTTSASPSPNAPVRSTPEPSTGDPEALPAYTATIKTIGPELRQRMETSHGPECPVPWRDLRFVEVSYFGLDAAPHVGELVVHRRYARAMTQVFSRLYAARWPIGQLRLVDDYAGDDGRSMAANNSSGYNCRPVAGSDAWSQHAYGAAVDLNPAQNPYVQGSVIEPPAGQPFADIDRSAGAEVPPGVIRAGDVVVEAFAAIGWKWGGDWSSAKDYQHFSASGD